MAKIGKVASDSIAHSLNIKPGDKIITVNQKPISDYIDFLYETSDVFFKMTVEKKDGTLCEFEVERSPGQKLGIEFQEIIYDSLKTCSNNCLFCFIDQMPRGLRKSLYIKDDDYRFSFLQGSYITLSNLKKSDWNKIIDYHLSPLNISIHTTNPQLRRKMMGSYEAGKIKKQLTKLTDNNINFNAQIVLCPGINDGRELEKTIEDLQQMYPNIISLGIVPVGLTKYNTQDKLKTFSGREAKKVINQVQYYQNEFQKKFGPNWLFLADEFYFLADMKIPEYKHYRDFYQLENGIGLTRLMRKKFSDLKEQLPEKTNTGYMGIITSVLGYKALEPVIKELEKIKGLNPDLISVENKFLGSSVTVTGLLAGEDIIEKINHLDRNGLFLIPEVALNNEGCFIDEISIEDIQQKYSKNDIRSAGGIKDIIEVIQNE